MFYEYAQNELLNEIDGGEVVGSMEKGSNSVSGII